MNVLEFDSKTLLAELRDAHERSCKVGYLECGGESRDRSLVVVSVEVENELAFVRYTLSVAYYETKASSAGARVMYLVAWCFFSGYHVTACATIQYDFGHDVLPVVDSEEDVVLVWLNDAQLRIVIVPMIFIPCGLIHLLLVSDSLRSGRIE